MSPFFEDVERDLVAAAQRRADLPLRRRASRGSALAVAVAIALGAGSTAAATAYYVLRASPIAPFAAQDSTPEQAVEPGTSRVLDVRAEDPDRSQPPWALRLSRSRAGLLCGTVGQVDGEEFGIVGLDGRFRGVPEPNADACGQDVEGDATLLGARIFDAPRFRDVRTVVSGVARDLERVTVSVRGGGPRAVPHSPEGGFVLALRGYPEDVQPAVTLRLKGGRVRRHAFGQDQFVVPDPLRERAWKVQLFSLGGGWKPGEKPPKHTYRPECVTFGKARRTALVSAMAPPVCGLRRPFFAARRLAGDTKAPGDVLLTGDWNGHPPRTAVYGRARGTVVVRAPGLRRSLKTTVNGAFLVVLPPSVDPATVRVEAGGRRYGPTHGTVEDPRPR